jgi:hypothetical protein
VSTLQTVENRSKMDGQDVSHAKVSGRLQTSKRAGCDCLRSAAVVDMSTLQTIAKWVAKMCGNREPKFVAACHVVNFVDFDRSNRLVMGRHLHIEFVRGTRSTDQTE